LDQFEAALVLQPDSIEAHVGIARAEIAERAFQEAAQELEDLTRVHPTNLAALELLAHAYRELGKDKLALETQRRAEAIRAMSRHQ